MLTDEHINAAWREVTQESIHDSRERFARAIEAAATAPLLERIAGLEAAYKEMMQLAAQGADGLMKASQKIAELEAKLAQRVPDGWKPVPVEPTEEMIDAGCEVDAREQAMEANRRRFATAAVPLGHEFSTAGQELRIRYTAMLAAAPAAPEQQETVDPWMPIETAPKDGTRVLICQAVDEIGEPITGEDFGIFVHRAAWWNGEGWIVYNDMVHEKPAFFEPTHWMPIPPPPKT